MLTVVFALAAAIYFWLFFTTNAINGQLVIRLLLNVILLFDELVYMWLGNDDFSRFGILDRIPILLAAGVILGTGYLAGRLLMGWAKVEPLLTRLERTVFAIGVGLNALSLYILLVGLAGGLRSRFVMLAPTLLLASFAAVRWRSLWRRASSASLEDSSVPNRDAKFVFWLGLPFVVVMLAGSLLPPWHFDSREYHAQIPKQWYQQGRIDFVAHNVYGNMPLGAELHGIAGMNLMTGDDAWWYGSLVGKVVIASYAPLTALLIYAFGIRFLTRTAGAIAALIFISTPWISYVSFAGLIDGVSAFYLLASGYAFLIWRDQSQQETPDCGGFVMLAGFLAGSAVACKYPALVFVVIPIGIGITLLGHRRWDVKAGFVFAIAVAFACGPWFAKNAVMASNPTYPLLADVFGGKTRTPEKTQRWTRAHRVPDDESGHPFGLAHIRSSATLLLLQSDYTSPLLVPLAIMSLFARRHRTTLAMIAALIAFDLLAWWCLTHRVDRFLVPILPLVALLCGVGATWSDDTGWRRTSQGLILGILIYNLVFIVSPVISPDIRFLISYKEIRRDIPINTDVDRNWVHPAHRILNDQLPPGYQVMLVGEAQVFDMEVPILYNTCFDDCVFEQTLKDVPPEQRLAALREKRISHVFVFWEELKRYRNSYGYSNYVTRDLIQQEFVETGLLRAVPIQEPPERSQLFEVVGWQDWGRE